MLKSNQLHLLKTKLPSFNSQYLSAKHSEYTMSEKLCLQWNNFNENIVGAFGSLRQDNDFTDVTLASEDGDQIEVHKVILASSSPFFQNILKRNKHPHPLIYMRGLKSANLLAIIDFLYCGEANVFQENLDSFLAIAEELQLKGLMGKDDADEKIQKEFFKIPLPKKSNIPHKNEASMVKTPAQTIFSEQIIIDESNLIGGTLALTSQFSGDVQELEEKCLSMMEKTSVKSAHANLMFVCKVCGKETTNSNMKHHIEANHLEGVSLPCDFSEKTSRLRKLLKMHIRSDHKGSMCDFSS